MNLTAIIEQGHANPLLLVGTALTLGAIHGMEPGHSKTMMAAFIIAIRGTVSQAVILGLSAVVSHSIIVWALALLALTYGDKMIAEELEPWFMAGSGIIIIAIAGWMFWQTLRNRASVRSQIQDHPQDAPNHHHYDHADDHDHDHSHPHDDAHARAHARQIEKQFAAGRASTGQVVWFGLTGGMIPCPAAVTVLIVCLHLQQFWLGVGLVGAFSVGLALTLIAVGMLAAWGVSVARRRSSRFEALFAAAPYVSALLIGSIGAIMLFTGYSHIMSAGHP